MGAYYRVREFSNPQDASEDPKWYAIPYSVGTLETRDLAKIVAERSGHSIGQLIGLFQDYFLQIEEHILAGQSVSMSPIGTVIAYFRGSGVLLDEEYDTDNISRIHLAFRPSPSVAKKIQTKYNGGELSLQKWGE